MYDVVTCPRRGIAATSAITDSASRLATYAEQPNASKRATRQRIAVDVERSEISPRTHRLREAGDTVIEPTVSSDGDGRPLVALRAYDVGSARQTPHRGRSCGAGGLNDDARRPHRHRPVPTSDDGRLQPDRHEHVPGHQPRSEVDMIHVLAPHSDAPNPELMGVSTEDLVATYRRRIGSGRTDCPQCRCGR